MRASADADPKRCLSRCALVEIAGAKCGDLSGAHALEQPAMSDTKTSFEPEKSGRLSALVEAAGNARLSPAEEDEAVQLLRDALAGGRASLGLAVESAVALPWSIGVKAAADAWPELKATARRYVITGLREHKSEAGKRYRLSLSRGLLPIDPAAATKLAVEACQEMLGESGEAMGPRDRQCFANVFVGKGRPWLVHLPISDWKPAEADALIRAAVSACFNSSCPPFTQLAILKWIGEAGRLGKLPESAVAAIQRSVSRWQGKWKAELREAALADLPEPVAEAAAGADSPEPAAETEAMPDDTAQQPQEDAEEQAEPPRRQVSRRETIVQPRRTERRGESFDLSSALRQIDSHVMALRGELQQAQAALRSRPSSQARGRGSRRDNQDFVAPAEAPEDVEALRRHNERLEATVTELRERLEELTANDEDHAAVLEGSDPLKALLGIKLREDYAVYESLRSEAQDEVVRTHLRDVLAHIFEVLQSEGVSFED